MSIKILNKKEVKKILSCLKEQFSISDLNLDYVFLLGGKDKVYVVEKKLAELDIKNLRINSVGMYFGKLEGGKLRLSIEGSQLIGPFAKKNVVTLSKEEIGEWVRGNDVSISNCSEGIFLVKYGDDFYGSSKYAKGKLLNFVPKSRRIRVLEKDLVQ